MKQLLAYCWIATFLAGCVHVPLAAKIDGTDDVLLGNATGYLTGQGDFEAKNLDGLYCKGSYNSIDQSPTIEANVSCSDGRDGVMLITRNKDLQSGSGKGKLSDGSIFKFVFGDSVHERDLTGFWEKL